MLTEYIRAAMKRAKYELIGDGTFFGDIPECPGLWANAPTLEACRDELQSTLEDWILISLWRRIPMPILDGFDLNAKEETEEEEEVKPA